MKKLFALLFSLLLVFSLVACKKNDDKGNTPDDKGKEDTEVVEKSITVVFETNGGSAIASQKLTISADGKVSFTLPNDPIKNGYVFGGWFVDSACEKEFKELDLTKETVTLYAKWTEEEQPIIEDVEYLPELKPIDENSINYETEISEKVLMNGEEFGTINLKAALKVSNLAPESLNDIDVVLELTPTINIPMIGIMPGVPYEQPEGSEGDELSTALAIISMVNGQSFTLVVQDGKLYAKVPGAMLGATDDMVLAVAIEPVIEALAKELEEALPLIIDSLEELGYPYLEGLDYPYLEELDYPYLLDNLSIEALINFITELITPILEKLENAGFTTEFIENLLKELIETLPEPEITESGISFRINQEVFGDTVEGIAQVAKDNYEAVVQIIKNVMTEFGFDDPEHPVEFPSIEEVAGEIDGFADVIKSSIILGENLVAVNFDADANKAEYIGKLDVEVPEQVSAKGTINAQLSDRLSTLNAELTVKANEEEIKLSGNAKIENDEKSSTLTAGLECAFGNDSAKLDLTGKAERESETKGSIKFDVTATVKNNDPEFGTTENTVKAGFELTKEVKDNTSDTKVKFTADAGEMSLEYDLEVKLTDNGKYTKVIFDGSEFAIDFTETVVALIDSIVVVEEPEVLD